MRALYFYLIVQRLIKLKQSFKGHEHITRLIDEKVTKLYYGWWEGSKQGNSYPETTAIFLEKIDTSRDEEDVFIVMYDDDALELVREINRLFVEHYEEEYP